MRQLRARKSRFSILSSAPKKWALAAALAAVVACATRQPGDPLKPGYNLASPQEDIELGRQAAAEVRRQVQVVQDPQLQSYVKSLGQRLAAQPEAGDWPFEFTVINEPSINAFALPGGPIFVHSGLISAADNEGELVGVLAHEIAHVTLRHGTSQASKAQMIQLPAVLAGVLIGDGGALSQISQVGLGLGLNALIMKYSRNAEKEADALGARIMAGAGYNPVEMARFFQKLEEQGGARPPALLSSHPSPGNRVKLVEAEMATFPAGTYTANSGQFPQAKQMVANLPPPPKPQQDQLAHEGAARAPSAPSGAGFQQASSRDFSLAYPQGWEIFGDQQSNTVTIAPRQGLVRTRQGGVELGYGTVLSTYQPRFSRDALNGTYELIDELQEMNPSLRVVGAPRQVNVQGSPGLVTVLQGRSPYGGAERDVLLTVPRPNGMFYMVFVGPESDFQQLEPTFGQIVESIRFR
jgi:beta-barrel assembly-enhancing protease